MVKNRHLLLISIPLVALLLSAAYLYVSNNGVNDKDNSTNRIEMAKKTLSLSPPEIPAHQLFSETFIDTVIRRAENMVNLTNTYTKYEELSLAYERMNADFITAKTELSQNRTSKILKYLKQAMSYAEQNHIYTLMKNGTYEADTVKQDILSNATRIRGSNNYYLSKYKTIINSVNSSSALELCISIENRIYNIESSMNQTLDLVHLYEGNRVQGSHAGSPPELYLSGASGLLVGADVQLSEVEYLLSALENVIASNLTRGVPDIYPVIREQIQSDYTAYSHVIKNGTWGYFLLNSTDAQLVKSDRMHVAGLYYSALIELARSNATLYTAYYFRDSPDPFTSRYGVEPTAEEVFEAKTEYIDLLVDVITSTSSGESKNSVMVFKAINGYCDYYYNTGDELLERYVDTKVSWNVLGSASQLMYQTAKVTLELSVRSTVEMIDAIYGAL